jgi:hypothetical protein
MEQHRKRDRSGDRQWRHSTDRDRAHRDRAHRDSAHRDSAQRGSAHRDSAQRGRFKRDRVSPVEQNERLREALREADCVRRDLERRLVIACDDLDATQTRLKKSMITVSDQVRREHERDEQDKKDALWWDEDYRAWLRTVETSRQWSLHDKLNADDCRDELKKARNELKKLKNLIANTKSGYSDNTEHDAPLSF